MKGPRIAFGIILITHQSKPKGGTMRKIQETLQVQITTTQDIMYIAFEFSNSTWRLASSDGNKKLHVTIKARDLKQLEIVIQKA